MVNVLILPKKEGFRKGLVVEWTGRVGVLVDQDVLVG